MPHQNLILRNDYDREINHAWPKICFFKGKNNPETFFKCHIF